MNLNLVRVQRFVAVAEQLSFTRAAASLGIDQPWLSRQVMQLEDQLGIMLFDRSGSRIALTPEGQEFFEVARQIDIAAQRVREKAEEMSRRGQATISLGIAYSTYSMAGRHALIERYGRIRPDVTFNYTGLEWSDDVVLQVQAGEVDFGLAFGPILSPDIECSALDAIDMTLAVPLEDPLAHSGSVAFGDLAGRVIAVARKDSGSAWFRNSYAWIEEVGAIARVVPEGRRYIFDVAERERAFVCCYTSADKLPESYVRKPLREPKPDIPLLLLRRKRIMSPAAERFWRLGQEIARERLTPVT